MRNQYPRIFTEAKISMALYKRWLDLKNGVCTRDFKLLGDDEIADENEDFDLE